MKAASLWSALPRALVTTPAPTPGPVHLLAFVCARCHAIHPLQCASDAALTTEERRDVLLQIEPRVIADGWSIGTDADHCPRCAQRLGLPTARTP